VYYNRSRRLRLYDKRVSFEGLIRTASYDTTLLRRGIPGSRVVVPLQKGDTIGRILVEIKEGPDGPEAVIIGSQFPPLWPCDLGLPIRLLIEGHVDGGIWVQLTWHQRELLKALRWACRIGP
jgi:hypothetical protein